MKVKHYDELEEITSERDDEKELSSTGDQEDESKSKELELEESIGFSENEGQDVVADPIQRYLYEIGRVNLLTALDERDLAKKVELGKRLRQMKRELSLWGVIMTFYATFPKTSQSHRSRIKKRLTLTSGSLSRGERRENLSS